MGFCVLSWHFPVDNAAEAALETGMMVEVVRWPGEALSLRVSNPYAGTIDLDSTFHGGLLHHKGSWGLGLPSYQRILSEHPTTAASTSWQGACLSRSWKVGTHL